MATSMLVQPRVFQGIQITCEAADLTGVVPGEDLWRHSYVVSGAAFRAGEGFAFDLGLYSNLEAPPPAVADVDPIVLQPDPVLLAPGSDDAQALVDSASLAMPFVVSFVWLGTGTPGTVRSADHNGAAHLLSRSKSGVEAEVGNAASVLIHPEPSTDPNGGTWSQFSFKEE